MTTKERVRLKLDLHPGQREVRESEARFRVVACGRQWGKSRLGSAVAFEKALAGNAVWWVAPDANVAAIGWDLLKRLARQVPTVEIAESKRILRFPSGGWIQVKGAHNEGKLRGVTLDFLVLDEAAFIPSGDRWNSELRPTLAVRNGGALFISTFDGFNWFHDLYQLGQDPEVLEWESWRKPSTESPYFSLEELEQARRTTPRAEFEQEYLASPLSRVGAVFPGNEVQRAVEAGSSVEGRNDLSSYAGLDWGYAGETALEVCQEDAEGRVHWIDERRWTAVELNLRCAGIVECCKLYSIEMIAADAAGATENATLAVALKNAGLKTVIQPVPFNRYKGVGIQARRWYLQNGMEAMSPKCNGLISDTRNYHYKDGTEDVVKESDHTIDACTAWYATRARKLIHGRA